MDVITMLLCIIVKLSQSKAGLIILASVFLFLYVLIELG